MTQPAPPLPPALPQPPTLPRAARWTTALAWLVILASAAFIIATTVREKRAGAGREVADVGFRIAARYAVGARRALPAQPGPATQPQSASLYGSVETAAKSRDDKVRSAVVAGELFDTAAAARALDSLPMPSFEGEDVDALRALYGAGDAGALTPAQRGAIVARHGWFGRLALSHGLPADAPARRDALRPAVRTFWLLLAATLGLILALAIGLGLLVTALVLWLNGRLVPAYRPPAGPTGPFVEAFAAYIAGMVGISALARLLFAQRVIGIWFLLVVLPAVFFWPLLRGVSRPELRAGLGWHRGRGLWREVGAGVAGYFAGLPVLAAGAMITVFLQRFSGSDTSHPIVNEVAGGGWRTVRLFLLAAVWAPVVEETMFRGALYHHLRGRVPWPAAAGLVAVLFAAIHPQGWAAIPVLGAIGFSFAALREWRGSVIAPATAHAINNGAVTVLLVLVLG